MSKMSGGAVCDWRRKADFAAQQMPCPIIMASEIYPGTIAVPHHNARNISTAIRRIYLRAKAANVLPASILAYYCLAGGEIDEMRCLSRRDDMRAGNLFLISKNNQRYRRSNMGGERHKATRDGPAISILTAKDGANHHLPRFQRGDLISLSHHLGAEDIMPACALTGAPRSR